MSSLVKRILVVTFLYFIYSYSNAQQGILKGVITDDQNLVVPGAVVQIQNINQITTTDFDGKFIFFKVPTGLQTLKISYLGYSDTYKEVSITDNQTIILSIKLASSEVKLDAITILGIKKGQQKALNTQKNNINITNVVATDQIGKFPDANIGDAVKRIPGITMQVDQGEARNIIVRGLSPQLNSVTLNGSRIPSAEGNNRNVQMDLIPSDMIQTIEVSKAVTPDMEADALGGSVNLITRTSPQGFRLATTLGSGINFITHKRIINGALLLGDRSKDKKFGWMISASINDNDFGSDNVEAEWSNTFEYATGRIDNDGDPIIQTQNVQPYTDEFQIRKYLVQRIRRSFSANFEYLFDSNNSMYFKSMYNWRDDRENRFRLSHKILDGEEINQGDFTIESGILTQFPVEASRQTKGGIDNNRNQNRRLEDQRMQNYSLGGDHLFGNVNLDWMASFSKASEKRLYERYVAYESEYTVVNDNSNPRFPNQTPQSAIDLSSFEYDEITEENQRTREEDINFFANVTVPFNLYTKAEGIVKFGVRSRLKRKVRTNDFFEFDLQSDFLTLSSVPIRNYTDPDFLAGNQYAIGVFPDQQWLGRLTLFDGTPVPDEFLGANFNVEEDVTAGYFMTNQKLSNAWTVLFGIRAEHTIINATGNQIKNEEDLVGTISDSRSYTNVLPGVHFKFNLSPRHIFRFAWTNTLARPNYVDLVPTIDIVDEEEISLGNSELKPTTSMNFDLMTEYYFKSLGLVSGGLFYKEIDDFIYTQISKATDDQFGENTTGLDVIQPVNGGDAQIFGFEAALQRQLTFLPGFAKNFDLYVNFTYLISNADGIRNEDGELRSDIDLPNTAPYQFNGSLAYSTRKLQMRLSANFSDSYIDEIGANSFEDRYYDYQFFLDFNASYILTKNLSLFLDINNITNQPLRYFQGVSERTMQMEYYDRRLTVGLKYDVSRI